MNEGTPPGGGEGDATRVLVDLLTGIDPGRATAWAERLVACFGGAAPALAADESALVAVLQCRRAAAALGAHRRAMLWVLREAAVRRPVVATRHAFVDYLRQRMAFASEERLRAFFLDAGRGVIAEEEIARGGPDTLAIEPRQILSRAIALGATGLILVHNHPGGDPEPSAADRRFTRRLAVAGAWLGVRLHDHLIVARGGHAIVAVPPAAGIDVANP